MQWNEIEGQWHKFKGLVRREWGKLTDDDLEHVGGNRERLAGKIQERYGIRKEEAQQRVDDWVEKQ